MNHSPNIRDLHRLPDSCGGVPESNALTALLLEDEPLICLDIEIGLAGAGLSVSYVMSCEDANAWLDLCSPDVVIIDIHLRDGQCTDVVSRLIRADIPFVIHSGDLPSMHVDTPFMRGEWVSKPATPEALLKAAHTAAAGHAYARSRRSGASQPVAGVT